MTFNELLAYQKGQFEAIAKIWLQTGASSVVLLENGEVIAANPDVKTVNSPTLIARDKNTGLELQIYDFEKPGLQANADLQVQMLGRILSSEKDLDALTSSLVETQDRLVALYDLSKATRHAIEIDYLLDLITAAASRLLDANGAFAVVSIPGKTPIIRQYSDHPLPDSQLLKLANLYRQDPSKHTFKDNLSVPPDLKNAVMSYLPIRDNVFACLGVISSTGDFTAPDYKLLKAITDQVGANLDNALLYQETIQQARLETEMNLARQVQTSLMPQNLPVVQGIDIYGVSIPALQVGGDFFEAMSTPQHPLFFLVGDVTGKGMPAALLMSMTHSVAQSAVHNMPFQFPHEILERLNKDLLDDYSSVGMFSTAFAGILDASCQQLMYSNAGQSPIIFASPGHEPLLLEADDLPIGIFEGHKYTSKSIDLHQGDVLLGLTDGFNESRNPDGELFGIDRLMVAIQKILPLSAKEIADSLLKTVSDFAGDHPQDDDRTLVVLKING